MTIAHISNGELGFDVRSKLNALIDQANIAPGGGTGDVTGPASAAADAIAVYNGTTGKLIKDGGQTIAGVVTAAVAMTVLVSDTAPVGAPANSLWWSSATGVMSINYNDGTSTQWVVIKAAAA